MEALKEAVKEWFRIALISVIPTLLAGISPDGTFNVDFRVLVAAVIISTLKALDKWVHESPDVDAKGIVPF